MFTKHIGATGQLFMNQSILKGWDGRMHPARDWGWGLGLRFWLVAKK
jgi:hypothetical protein